MSYFVDFKYSWALHLGASVRDKIYGEDSLVVVADYWSEIDDDFVSRALRPSRDTFLHEIIRHIFVTELEYLVRKSDSCDLCDELQDMLVLYGVPFLPLEAMPEEDDESDLEFAHLHYLVELVETSVAKSIGDEVFTLLFADRDALKKLNLSIAESIVGLKKIDHPRLLARDGRVRRFSRWPMWMKRGVFFRDNGRCVLCGKDLSGLLDAEQKLAWDHVVPLNLGGTNDATNIQLLCKECNRDKSGDLVVTSEKRHLFWEVV